MDNIIYINFTPEVFAHVNEAIHHLGVSVTAERLLAQGHNISYVKVLIRKVLRMRGGK